jgi:hypothetical protein
MIDGSAVYYILDLYVDVTIILKWIIKNLCVRVCRSTHLNQNRVQCRAFVNSMTNLLFL